MQDNANSDLGEAPPRHEVAVTCSAPQGQRAQDNNDATSEGIAPTHEEIDGTLRAYDRAGTQRSEERLDEQLRWLHQYIANARTPTAMQLCYADVRPEAEASGRLLAGKGLCGGPDSATPKTTPENGLVRGYETLTVCRISPKRVIWR